MDSGRALVAAELVMQMQALGRSEASFGCGLERLDGRCAYTPCGMRVLISSEMTAISRSPSAALYKLPVTSNLAR